MNQTEILERLMQFGLTRQEATIYLCLLQHGEITGYEVAKQTGISRSNVYSALAGLTDKGAAFLMEGATSKYIPAALEEFCCNKIFSLEADKQYLLEHVKTNEISMDGYITVTGMRHILDKIHQCLFHTEFRVYFYAPKDFILKWKNELEDLVIQNKKVVLLTDEDLEIEGCIVYKTFENTRNQMRLIIDSKYILTGTVPDSTDSTCLFSGQEDFVEVFKDALRNEIKLVELLKDTENSTEL